MEAAQCLLEVGLNLNAKNSLGLTPIDKARLEGHHLLAWWLRKQPHAVEETPRRQIERRCRWECEGWYEKMLRCMREEDLGSIRGCIPLVVDGHLQDDAGMTLLHHAAQLGLTRVVSVLLESCEVYPHAVTWAGDTPSDLAQREGHHQVLDILHRHQPQVQMSPQQLYEQLLSVISQVMTGALEPVGDWSVHPLATTSNRTRIVSLLVAAGALSITTHGLNLLTVAWCSPDVTPRVQVTITGVFLRVLQRERTILRSLPHLRTGVDHLIKSMEGDTPWRASWPRVESVVDLTHLMVQAARVNCTLTCSFLYQAGAQSSLCSQSKVTPVHAALDAEHWNLAGQMIKYMGGCLYVPDSRGRLPTHLMPPDRHCQLNEKIYEAERKQLEDIKEKKKDTIEEQRLQEVLNVQQLLFATNLARGRVRQNRARRSHVSSIGADALLVASQGGLQQLIYLLVKKGGVPVDTVLDATNDTTALHQAASHGKSECVILLLSLGAQPLLPDRYGQTPLHFAAMFGHDQTYQVLEGFMRQQEPSCRAGTTPREVSRHFYSYLKMYHKFSGKTRQGSDVQIWNNPTDATTDVLSRIDLNNMIEETEKINVDYSKGEAQEVRDVVMKELQKITENVSSKDRTYRGTLELLGSTADGTRLYCPDEYDFNILLDDCSGVNVLVSEQNKQEASLSGHKLRVEVKTMKTGLQAHALTKNLYSAVRQCLSTYTLRDKKVSIVPPGLTRTQVGVALSLAWQGSQYPLLLIGIDLVPIVVIPWPEEIPRPLLTPVNSQMMHLSNTTDNLWRCSFAASEVKMLKQLDHQERQVFLTGKALLSCMKAEPWMPKDLKKQFSWWDIRYWKIPTPEGFCFKNSFLRQLEKKRVEGVEWQEEDVMQHVISVFRGMCEEMVDPQTSDERLVPAKVHAYFGGDCERPKVGHGAPEIIEYIKKHLKKVEKPQVGYMGLRRGCVNQ
ncbi:serine/threonine-protein phosphatase 6 regulatory ankyrin repeat subunit C-like [Homarus americanus]|uniref:serine/threonine-protein phosphatase 6 regulatory ankyrin repeat subunit C-like n=1 Tax=Homarus americanus TaxID=6706 RepID=UPI001C46D0A1|nr:serine/threonine-protein phosphatase 6 regulatory ankyrin repeat subunit C-like [Homarus americanus]